MRFLVDENLPLSLARWLEERGFGADHTSVLGLNATPDCDIVRHALRLDCVIVTKDSDYRTITGGGIAPRVVHLRVGNRSSRELITLCAQVWGEVVAALEGGERVVQVGGPANA